MSGNNVLISHFNTLCCVNFFYIHIIWNLYLEFFFRYPLESGGLKQNRRQPWETTGL